MKVELEFIEPLLGTLSGNPEIAEEFIAAKHPSGEVQEDEAEVIEKLPEALEKSSTIFPRDEKDRPFIWDYQIKGFFKDACGMLRRVAKNPNSKLKAYKRLIDGLVFVEPRQIVIELSGKLDWTERPLRAMTRLGERVALARSETVPKGSKIKIDIQLLDPNLEEYVKSWLDYGKLRGLGQWRNASFGRFTWKKVE
ncbi:MAG: hypothetical protein ACFFCW_28950 [Candidatus Hodarchaeota archaeon]